MVSLPKAALVPSKPDPGEFDMVTKSPKSKLKSSLRGILADQVLEVRSFEGKIRIGRKARLPDAGDPSRVASDYDPYQTDDDLLLEEAPAAVVDPANVVV
jgi:hypothetical protein